MSDGSLRDRISFARHIPARQVARRLFLIGRRRIERITRPAITAAPAVLSPHAPPSPFPPRAATAWREANGWRFRFLNRALSCGPLINWHLGGTGDVNQLWTMNLHYFEWSATLNNAEFVEAFDQWIAACPADAPDAGRAAWNAYALSLRSVVLLQQFAARRGSLDPAWLDRTVRDIAGQLNYLERHLETDIGGNHLIKNIVALIWGSVAIVSADSPRWRRTGLALLSPALGQILPDGMHLERSPCYHTQVLADLISIRHALGADLVNGRLDDAIARAAQVAADLTHPDGSPALFGDSGLTMTRSPDKCFAAAALHMTPRDAFDLPDAGYAGIRHDCDLLLVDAGPLGPDALPAHSHGDIGSIEWSVAGDRIVVDQGVFEYVAGEKRQQSRTAASHNTLAAPGADQGAFFGAFRLGARVRVARREVSFEGGGMKLTVAHDGFVGPSGGARHERSIEATPDRIVINDRLDRPIPGAAIAFLLAPDVRVTASGSTIDLTTLNATCRIETDGEASIEDAVWWPDMGVEQITRRVRIVLRDRRCRTVLTVLARRGA